jgi:hypothetical protein
MHKELYAHDRPQLITKVFTSCLMYATRTEQTENIIVPVIEMHASALINEHSEAGATISMALARTQALLLYISMREPPFVERDLLVLERWTEHLMFMRDSSGASTTNTEVWNTWLFWECVSRTILASAYFISVHCTLARGEPPLA